ncbi:histidine kinase dimerization/phosphoacceptor domain -containing protein [Marinoscillum sp.]|uniref:histidine kinase dimerization/phosphoacceptor domain -containing protein n=1 Tax=Marinoscillum sp. TaxID=2024838 RepID=UPI003BAB5DDC
MKVITTSLLYVGMTMATYAFTQNLHPVDSLLKSNPSYGMAYFDSLERLDNPQQLEYLIEARNGVAAYLDQQHEYDSALGVLEQNLITAEESDLQKAYAEIYRRAGSTLYHGGNYDSAKTSLSRAIFSAKQSKQYRTLGRSLNVYGIVCRRSGQLDSSLIYYDKALEAYDQAVATEEYTEEELYSDLANIHKNKGIIYATLNVEDKALESFKKSVALEEAQGLEEPLAKSYLNLAVFYKQIKNYDKFKETLAMSRVLNEKLDKSIGLCLVSNNLGTYYAQIEDLDSAIIHFRVALKFANRAKNKYYQALVNQNIGNYFLDKRVYDSARIYTQLSIDQRKEIGYTLGVAQAERNLAELYVETGNPLAEEILLRCLEVFEQAKSPGDVTEVYDALIKYYEKQGNYQAGSAYWHKLYALSDSLKNQELFNKISNLEVQYEVQNYQDQVAQQEQIIVQNQKINYLLIAVILLFLIVVIGLVFAFMKLKNYNTQLRSKNTKIDLLMRELHHRVKNNLQVISSLLGLQSMSLQDEGARKVVEEGKSRVRAMSLIHQRLYHQENITSINTREYIEEIVKELTESYGFKDRLQVKLELDNVDLDVDTTLPLGLIINELVSNAFKYAYQDIDQPLLELELRTNDQNGKLVIADNGPGKVTKNTEQESFGLRLVNILTEQLNGTMKVSQEKGLRYELSFAISS